MEVSVIIPVYNCESWIEESIRSALHHVCVKEIIVVDDGSTDQTLFIVEQLTKENTKILLYQHPGGHNQGRSASRNLAISKASYDWIAFLDADDLFLANRFDGILRTENIDGVYGITESLFVEYDNKQSFEKRTEIQQVVAPEKLFAFLTNNSEERFSILTLIVKKSALLDLGGFDEELEIGEDTDLMWRIAYKYTLCAQKTIHPVSQRRVHQFNSYLSTSPQGNNRYLFYKKWLLTPPHPICYKAFKRVLNSYIYYHPNKEQSLKMFFLKIAHLLRYQMTILLG